MQGKTKRLKNKLGRTYCERVALSAGVKPRFVQRVLSEDTNMDTEAAVRVQIAACLMTEGENKLIEDIKRILPITRTKQAS